MNQNMQNGAPPHWSTPRKPTPPLVLNNGLGSSQSSRDSSPAGRIPATQLPASTRPLGGVPGIPASQLPPPVKAGPNNALFQSLTPQSSPGLPTFASTPIVSAGGNEVKAPQLSHAASSPALAQAGVQLQPQQVPRPMSTGPQVGAVSLPQGSPGAPPQQGAYPYKRYPPGTGNFSSSNLSNPTSSSIQDSSTYTFSHSTNFNPASTSMSSATVSQIPSTLSQLQSALNQSASGNYNKPQRTLHQPPILQTGSVNTAPVLFSHASSISSQTTSHFSQGYQSINQPSSLLNQETSLVNQQTTLVSQQSSLVNQQPNLLNQQRNLVNEQPNLMNQQPSRLNQQTTGLNKQPSGLNQQPNALNQQPSAQQPNILNQPSDTSNESSRVWNQQSGFMNQQPSALNQEPNTLNQPPNTLSQQTSVLNQSAAMGKQSTTTSNQPTNVLNQQDSILNQPPCSVNQATSLINQGSNSPSSMNQATNSPDKVNQPTKSINHPSNSVNQPSNLMNQPPTAMNQPPNSVNQPPSSMNQPPNSMNQPPLLMNQSPNLMNQPPSSINHPPNSFNKPPNSMNQPQNLMNQSPNSLNQLPTSVNQPKSSLLYTHASMAQPTLQNQLPNPYQLPSSMNQRPGTLTQPISSSNQSPAALNQPPTTLNQPPSSLNQPPSSLNQPPSSLNQPTSLNQPPTSLNQPPTSLNQPPTTWNQPPTTYQPITISNQPPTLFHKSSGAFNQPQSTFKPTTSQPQAFPHPPTSQPPPGAGNNQTGFTQPPPTTFNQPPSNYNAPTSNFNQPPIALKQPPTGFNQSASFNQAATTKPPPPPSNFNQVPPNMNQPPINFKQQQTNFPHPPNNFSQPPSNLKPPPSNMNQSLNSQQPPNNFKQAPPTFTQPPTTFNQPPTSLNQPPTSLNQPASFKQPPTTFSQSQASFNAPPTSVNQPPNAYNQSQQVYRQPNMAAYPQQNYPRKNYQQNVTQQMLNLSVTNTGFNKCWGHENFDLLQCPNILPPYPVEPPKIRLGQEYLDAANCSSDIFRCTVTKIPESNSLLQKSRLPLGVLIHPFKDLNHLPVIQCSTIVRCRACRTYINPFIFFVDSKRWKCNLCYRVNELPEEFQYDPVSKSYGDPSRRPEIKSSTIEYIAPSEYMLRPPQPAVYLYLLDISRMAIETGYLQKVCEVLISQLGNLPGDARTQIGFLAFNTTLHFFSIAEGLSQPHELIVSDIDDVFLPCPDNLLVNLKENMELITDLLNQLPVRYQNSFDTGSALGAALQAAFKLMSSTGGRVTVFQTCLPTLGPGALTVREDPNQRAGKEAPHLNPATDFYKRLALDCSAQQVAVDLFILNSQYVDIATLSGISRFSGGCIHHFPLFRPTNPVHVERFERCFKRYLTRKIGFEAVMRIRCTRGLAIHTFHGNFFVRSTDLLSLPNVNPDAGFGMQVSIEESLTDLQTVCFQAAVLYTSSKGERRIRVHTLCLPVASTLSDILNSADQQCIVGLIAKMAVDRSLQSSLSDARDAFINAAIDVLSSYKVSLNMGNSSSGLMAPGNLKLLPLYILALLKYTAFRTGQSTRLDDRVFAMCEMKSLPLTQLLQQLYPDLYPIHQLPEAETVVDIDGGFVPQLPRLHLSARSVDSNGVYLMDSGDQMLIFVCQNAPAPFLIHALGVPSFHLIPDQYYELPKIDNEQNKRLHTFINHLNEEKPYSASVIVIRENSPNRTMFLERLIEDRIETSLSYNEFLQHLKTQVK